MKLALISLSSAGARIAARIAEGWKKSGPLSPWERVRVRADLSPAESSSEIFLHAETTELPHAARFHSILDLTREIFPRFDRLVYVAPVGLVVRAVAPCLRHKTTDPGVVVVDVGARWAVSLVGGHEGGANSLAFAVANILGAEAVVTTSTEAAKDLIVGVGCRRGAEADAIVAAVEEALAAAGCDRARVRMLASADLKAEEAGLLAAAQRLGVPLRLVAADELRNTIREFTRSPRVQEKVNLPAVAEPAALLAGRRTQLLLPKTTLHGVTVAIARENSTPSA